jgi:hypothetical protein
MTRPTHVFLWMIPFLGLVALVVAVLYTPLAEAFQSNPAFNGIILLVFLAGIIINFRQVTMLSSEAAWINKYRGKSKLLGPRAPDEPRMLAPLAKLLGQHDKELLSLPHLPLRALLDSVRLRLDETRDVSRYMIGLLIFLGLLGTFWGLLLTVSGVGQMIGTLTATGDNTTAMFGSLMEGLHGPLSGMGTAFSSSLFGLAGSLVLGFLDLQASHAQNRFFNELEDWLSGVTRFAVARPVGEHEPSEPVYIHAMLEQTAETLDKLQRNVARDEDQRRQIGDQILALGSELATFADVARDEQRLLVAVAKGQGEMGAVMTRLAEAGGGSDAAMQEHLRSLDINIKRLVDEFGAGREHLAEEIRDELRMLSRTLSAGAKAGAKAGKRARAG